MAAERESMLEAVDQERLASAALTAAAAVRSEKLDDAADVLANREAGIARKERFIQDKAGPQIQLYSGMQLDQEHMVCYLVKTKLHSPIISF